jgi:adenylate cyclase
MARRDEMSGMSRPLERDTLRAIQDIVRREKGAPLERESVKEIEALLARLAAGGAPAPAQAGYSRREATILFADLRGFSAITSQYGAEIVLGLLNRCLGFLVDIIARHFGTVDKFIGDAIMAVFHGDPVAPRDHARRALLCAVEMQLAMYELRARHRDEKVPELYLGIGISTGGVMAGLIGSDAYRAYTVIGEEVNLASRIEALSLRGQVLISEATYEHAKDFVHVGEPMEVYVKGCRQRMRVREVLGVPALGKTVPRQDARKSPRVPVAFELEYWTLEGKVVAADAQRGIVRDLGYRGMLVEVAAPLSLYAELKLAFELPGVGVPARDVYARVVSIRSQGSRWLAGLEFTSLAGGLEEQIRLCVQMLIQGDYAGALPR